MPCFKIIKKKKKETMSIGVRFSVGLGIVLLSMSQLFCRLPQLFGCWVVDPKYL